MQEYIEKGSIYKFLISPIKNLKKKNLKEPLLLLTLLFIGITIVSGVISSKFILNNEAVTEIQSSITVEKGRLNLFLIIITSFMAILNGFTSNIIIAFIYKIIFILSTKDVNFRKVYYIFFYIGTISLLGVVFNGGLSILGGYNTIQSFSSLSFIMSDNTYIKALLKLLDVFFIVQVYILGLFLKEIACYSWKITFLILIVHTAIMYVSQLFI
ncbi:hypothetical protein BM74_29330 [Bacillus thuringiensis]|uniref:Yip1 domain-containing protein n=1 Tax=Bacillus thuringiensis TaxID=1428 RepID=A0A437SBJ1_BACTU|nr:MULTISPECIES: YIP1 family protein [Bacillus cereus group]KMN68147.1 hypothetical protein VK96_22080 [Bacillus cereus]RVU60823.1 hypothetical protein BM74_29330 [Bacillus thuringiensis]